MDALVTLIVLWLAANCELPDVDDRPHIELVTTAEMAAARHRELSKLHLPHHLGDSDALLSWHPRMIAFYSDATDASYLPSEWTGRTVAEVSVRVHEVVHFLQDIGKVQYDCRGAREKIAYGAQEKWLQLFNTNIEAEFGVDTFALFIRTTCWDSN
jgi:hypothetical protein